jgi:hypothetical protein
MTRSEYLRDYRRRHINRLRKYQAKWKRERNAKRRLKDAIVTGTLPMGIGGMVAQIMGAK